MDDDEIECSHQSRKFYFYQSWIRGAIHFEIDQRSLPENNDSVIDQIGEQFSNFVRISVLLYFILICCQIFFVRFTSIAG